MNVPNQLLKANAPTLLMALCAWLITVGAIAQAPQRTPTPNDTLKSPKVLDDKRVALQLYAPKANEVIFNGDSFSGTKPVSLTKNDQELGWQPLVHCGPISTRTR